MRRLSFLLTVFLLLTIFTGCGTPSIPSSAELSVELKAEIGEAWHSQFAQELLWNEGDDYKRGYARYYGTHKGMVILFIESDTNIAATGSITVAGQEMIWGYEFDIYVYVNETICTLSQAYSRELLSDKDVKQIAAIHDYYVIQKYGKKW